MGPPLQTELAMWHDDEHHDSGGTMYRRYLRRAAKMHKARVPHFHERIKAMCQRTSGRRLEGSCGRQHVNFSCCGPWQQRWMGRRSKVGATNTDFSVEYSRNMQKTIWNGVIDTWPRMNVAILISIVDIHPPTSSSAATSFSCQNLTVKYSIVPSYEQDRPSKCRKATAWLV